MRTYQPTTSCLVYVWNARIRWRIVRSAIDLANTVLKALVEDSNLAPRWVDIIAGRFANEIKSDFVAKLNSRDIKEWLVRG